MEHCVGLQVSRFDQVRLVDCHELFLEGTWLRNAQLVLARADQRVAFAVRMDAEAEGIAQPPEMRQLRKRTNLDGVHLSSEG